jgi:hypothetical protein
MKTKLILPVNQPRSIRFRSCAGRFRVPLHGETPRKTKPWLLGRVASLTLFIILSLTFTSSAEIPHIINYQGKATDAQGAPLNGAYNLTFRIYNHATAGDLLWSETHSNLTIVNGIFSVHLGDITPLTLPFDAPYCGSQ